MAEKTWHYKNIVECPKSAEFLSFARDCAFDLGISDITFETEESGWIFKHQKIRIHAFSVDRNKIEIFAATLDNAFKDYESQLRGY